MGPEGLLRLAWEVDREGRKRVRDSLLTLAVLECGPEDLWAERCRARLIADRPEHFLAEFPTAALALEDPRVVETREKLRVKHPRVRVERLLLAHRAVRGPYTGRDESIAALLEDLVGPAPTTAPAPALAEADHVRRDAPQPTRGPLARTRAARPAMLHLAYAPDPSRHAPEYDRGPAEDSAEFRASDPAEFARFYLGVLLAIACLLASIAPAAEDRPAD